MTWGGIAAGAGAVIGGVMSSRGASDAARRTRPSPFGVSGPAGSLSVDGNQLTLGQANSPFQGLFEALMRGGLGRANAAPGQFLYGATPEVSRAYSGLFGQGLTQGIQGQLDLLRQAAAPEEQRQSLGLEDALFARGQSGTTGGAERFRALEEAQSQADLQRQIQAIGLGRQEALDRFTGAIGASQQGMAGQLQNLNVGQAGFQNIQQLLQNLFQQAGLGVAAGGGQAPAAAIYAAQQAQAPWQAGFNFLNQSGLFNQGGGFNSGGVPMVPQPPYSPPVVTSGQFPMPSGNFGL